MVEEKGEKIGNNFFFFFQKTLPFQTTHDNYANRDATRRYNVEQRSNFVEIRRHPISCRSVPFLEKLVQPSRSVIRGND